MCGYACVRENGNSFDPKFLCPFCNHVLREPVQTNCGHRYCRACVQELLRSPLSKCLLDNEEIKREEIFEDKYAQREVLSLQVQCTNHVDGCQWRGDLGLLEDHENKCLFTKVQCMHHGCGVMVPRDDLSRHLKEDCDFREQKCNLCGLMTTADQLKHHQENECPEYTVECPNCLSVKLVRKQLASHMDRITGDCEAVEGPCPFYDVGCPDGKPRKRKENRDHQDKDCTQHLNFLLLYVQNLSNFLHSRLDGIKTVQENSDVVQNMDKTIQNLLCKVENIIDEHFKLTSVVRGQGSRISNLEKSIERFWMDEDLVPDGLVNPMHWSDKAGVNDVVRRLNNNDAKVANHEVLMVELNSMVQDQSKEMKRLEIQLRSGNEEIRKLQRRMENLEHSLSLRNVAATADLEDNIRQQESTSFNGVFIWKITDFARRRNEAITGKQVSLYSPCFYTSRHGYKMCVRIYLNGDGAGKGTHMSLYFVVMRGQYDALLRWPFRQKVTFMLLDQDNIEHMIDAFRPDPSSSSFQRPQRESNIPSGCPTFFPLSMIGNHAFVRDDTMFIKVIVDTTDT
ncbi:TNF receptor-associated factor 2-like [Montipora capricornis]|uniref:TNF receptor-associated factor 2-like n=1 Tax=Montipora capricornis TaxID=246305 RepID=UPI0035F1D350